MIKRFPEGFVMELDLSEIIDNQLFYNYHEHETEIAFREYLKEGMNVIDIGANIGYYTLLASKLVGNKGKVYSFEPTSKIDIFKKNISLNPDLQNIAPYNIAIGNFNGSKLMNIRSSYKIAAPTKEYTDLKDMYDWWGKYSEKTQFKFNTVDHFKFKKIDFIKIDVDGAEKEVIEGMLKTIKRDKPIIVAEIFKENFREIHSKLKALGYSCKPLDTLTGIVSNYVFVYGKV